MAALFTSVWRPGPPGRNSDLIHQRRRRHAWHASVLFFACVSTTAADEACAHDDLYSPSNRNAVYGQNVAQYLVDLHDANATFDFCGGMLFQLVLSPALRAVLSDVAAGGSGDRAQPVVYDPSIEKMHRLPGYQKDASADGINIFHGREVRSVPWAAGGMNFVLHLSDHRGDDPEGWTPQEVSGYDGWGHDGGRTWRNGQRLQAEGFTSFRGKFGTAAYALHHRFYLHLDSLDRLWLAAEDGCEGFPSNVSSIRTR